MSENLQATWQILSLYLGFLLLLLVIILRLISSFSAKHYIEYKQKTSFKHAAWFTAVLHMDQIITPTRLLFFFFDKVLLLAFYFFAKKK